MNVLLDAAPNIQVSTPSLAFLPRLVEAEEPARVQALGAELAVQAFDEGVIRHDCGGALRSHGSAGRLSSRIRASGHREHASAGRPSH
jgi:hypothetical protein